MPATKIAARELLRNLLFLSTPALWSHWPYLPLVRRKEGQEDECGLLCDLCGLTGKTDGGLTVFLCNFFLLPHRWSDFLALPREVYSGPEETYAGGWRVD
jgi:hypothetical protein